MASLRLLSLVGCGIAGGPNYASRFAAHPHLRIRTAPGPSCEGGVYGVSTDEEQL